MGIAIDVVRVACNTSTGTQNITGSLGGLTPKAALFVLTPLTADGTVDGAQMGWGGADGTNQFAYYMGVDHGIATTNVGGGQDTDVCIKLTDGTPTLVCEAAFSSWLTNGVQINWSTAPSSAYLLTVTLFAGTDLSAYVGNTGSLGNTVDTVNDITSVGFEPDVVLPFVSRYGSDNIHYVQSLGMVVNGATIEQQSVSWSGQDGRTGERSSIGIRNDAGISVIPIEWNIGFDWWGEFSDFDANGFSITTRNDGASSCVCNFLALNFNGVVSAKAITPQTPTSTGSDSETGLGFHPIFIYQIPTLMTSINTGSNTAPSCGARAIGMWGPNGEYTNSTAIEDNAATSNTQSSADNIALDMDEDDGTAGLTATLTSFDSQGFTLNYTAVEGSACYTFVLGIEDPAYAFTLDQEGFRFRNDDGSESAASWRQAQDTNDVLSIDQIFRLRTLINATNDPSPKTFQLEWAKKQKTLSLSDAFTDNSFDTSKWEKKYNVTAYEDQAVTVLETGNIIEVTPLSSTSGAHANGCMSKSTYNFYGKMITIETVQATNLGTAWSIFGCIAYSETWGFGWSKDNANLFAEVWKNTAYDNTSETWNASAHKWLRIRHSKETGLVYFEKSPDGVNFTVFRSIYSPFPLDAITIQPIAAGTYNSVATPGTAQARNFTFKTSEGVWNKI